MELFALPVSKPPINKDEPDKWPDNALVSAFWWVGTTTNKKAANMEHGHIVSNGINVPVLKNHVDIGEHEKLMIYVKPKAKVEPLQNVITPSADDDDAAPVAKKAAHK